MFILSQAAAFTPLTWNCLSVTVTVTTHTVVTEFFTHLYLYPGQHVYAIISMVVATVGLCVGAAFLVKLVYDKVMAHEEPTDSKT